MIATTDRTKQIKVVVLEYALEVTDAQGILDGFISDTSESDVIVDKKEPEEIILFEGLSNETKVELKANWGQNIIVYYQQKYTTISAGETYAMALENTTSNFSKECYTEAEFIVSAQEAGFDPILWAYSQKDLDKKLGVTNTKQKQPKTRITPTKSNFSAYLFTSMTDLNDGDFPITGITREQVMAAKASLEEEDFALAEHANANNLSINSDEVRGQQIEACIFLVGSVKGLENYISTSGVKWIGIPDSNRKGLIKNTVNSSSGQQVILLIIDVRLRANRTILTQLGYYYN
jgi:hypothetical protein